MKNLSLIYFINIVLIFTSCSNSRQIQLDEIKAIETKLYKDTLHMLDLKVAEELVASYIKFSTTFPNDTLAPKYLLNAAEVAMNIHQSEKAVECLNTIIEKYPSFNKMPQAIFLLAFIYENNIQNLAKAKFYYQEFLKKYPNHELALSAKNSIENLGLTPEQLIKKFEAQKNQDSITAKQ